MKSLVVLALSAFALSSSHAVNLLENGGFEMTPEFRSPQTDIDLGGRKMIMHDESHPDFGSGIWAVPHWLNALNGDLGSDQGIARQDELVAPEGERWAFINNWNRRFSQPTTHLVQAGESYSVRIWIGSKVDDARCGRVSLLAGALDPANYDEFATGTNLLVEKTAGTAAWGTFVPDHLIPGVGWQEVALSYSVAANDSAIGKPLLVSIRTEEGSVGPVEFDDVRLEVVPEPATLVTLAVGAAACARRFRR